MLGEDSEEDVKDGVGGVGGGVYWGVLETVMYSKFGCVETWRTVLVLG
jgi:hypothetical protein